jgi:hypothetical protein
VGIAPTIAEPVAAPNPTSRRRALVSETSQPCCDRRPRVDIRPCQPGDQWQVRPRRAQTYRLVIANGPPDRDTIVRRRVDPPAGCRAAAEPAALPTRRSFVELPGPTAPVHVGLARFPADSDAFPLVPGHVAR